MATSSAAARPCPTPEGSIAIDNAVADADITNRILATTRIYLALEPDGLRYAPARLREQGGEFVDPQRYRLGAWCITGSFAGSIAGSVAGFVAGYCARSSS